MAKIKKIKELKSKIKIIKEIKRGESELVDDVEKAEEHVVQVFREDISGSEFKPPSIALESDVEESGPATAIQQETRERREIEETNIAYAPRRESGAARSYQEGRNEEEREYRHSEDVARNLPTMRFEESAFKERVISKREGHDAFSIQDSEIRDERFEIEKRKYKTRRE